MLSHVACVVVQFYPWFKFYFLCFKLIIIHYHTPKQREIKFEPRIKLNHNTCILILLIELVIYPLDRAIQLLNNWSLIKSLSFYDVGNFCDPL